MLEPTEAEHARRMLEELQRASESMADEQFTASSDDGYVTVTVDAAGYPVGVELDPRVFRPPVDSEGVAETILACCGTARERAERVTAEYREALRAQLPTITSSQPDDLAGQLRERGQRLLGRVDGGGHHG